MERLERKEREFNTRRADILDKAEKIFAQRGFHNVTMAEIAAASGFAIGSLYQFFEGKEALYSTIITEKLDLMYTTVRTTTETAESEVEKIEKLIDAHLLFIEQNTDFCRLFIKGESAALSETMTSLRQKLIDDHFKHITFIENILRDGIKKGLLRALPPRDMAQSLFSLIKAVALEWMLESTNDSPCSKKEYIKDIFFNGVKKNE
jgi:AcrR family transcriptional regulator